MPGTRPGTNEFRLRRTPQRLFFVALKTFPGQPCAFAGTTNKYWHSKIHFGSYTWTLNLQQSVNPVHYCCF